jgi:mannose-6-phosphate isomerase-like protein (cupin superfamily)
MKSGKVWGQTELIHSNGALEFHRIEFEKGYLCSQHKHVSKWNGFFVESGELIVRIWHEHKLNTTPDETHLEAGDFTQVMPGLFHQFEGVKKGVAFELYWSELSHYDIIRRTTGGRALPSDPGKEEHI